MEDTVTMSLDRYDELNNRIHDLEKLVEVIEGQLKAVNHELLSQYTNTQSHTVTLTKEEIEELLGIGNE